MLNLKIDKKIFLECYRPYVNDYSHRYEVYYGGAGSGKSFFVAQKVLLKALTQKRKVLIIRKVANTLKDSVFSLVLKQLSLFKIRQYCKINLSSKDIFLPNGSVLMFRGLDDNEKIKSIDDITDIWAEEPTELIADDFTQLDIRIRTKIKDSQFFLSFNPVSKLNWVYKKWFAPGTEINPETTFILKTTYKDNNRLSEDYIKTVEDMINTNYVYYRIYTLGEFCTTDKLVITNWEKQEFDENEIAKKFENRNGGDIGHTDPTALYKTFYDKENKTIYVSREFYERGCTEKEILEGTEKIELGRGLIRIDSANPSVVTMLKNNGKKAKSAEKPKDSVEAGLLFLKSQKIIVHPRCVNLIDNLENFSYIKDAKTGEYTDKTTHEYSHGIDGVRYAYADIYTKRTAKTLDKSILGL